MIGLSPHKIKRQMRAIRRPWRHRCERAAADSAALRQLNQTEDGMDTRGKIHVLVAHADDIVSAGLQALLAACANMVVTAAPASALAEDLAVDVIVTDHRNALLCCRAPAQAKARRARVLIVTQKDTEWDVHLARMAGVQGYLLHSDGAVQLELAVLMLDSGARYMSPSLQEGALSNPQIASLTRRENDVLMLLAEGCCNKTIARELSIEVGTVKTHVKGLFAKLGARARTHAVVLGAQRGLIQYGGRTSTPPSRPHEPMPR